MSIVIDGQWQKSYASQFGFKCIASKHEKCTDKFCVCLCHGVNR